MARSRAQQAAIAIEGKQAGSSSRPAKKSAAKKSAAKKSAAKKSATKKSASKKSAATKVSAGKSTTSRTARTTSAEKKTARKAGGKQASLPKAGRDPKGGLNAAGRKFYNEQTGGHLRPGVKGTPKNADEKKRKGSFLVRHFANPPGPVVKNGEPTRQALQAAAWGEPVPQSEQDEAKLAAKGRALLDEARREPHE